ncbi:MAG: hypothetical protein AAF721_25170 [Myxococcota bacterium]
MPLAANLGCGPPSNGDDPMFASAVDTAGDPSGSGDGAGETTAAESGGDTWADSTSAAAEDPPAPTTAPAGDTGGDAEQGESSGDGTDTGDSGSGSDGGGAAGVHFGECLDVDEVTCSASGQCQWSTDFADLGECIADPAFCGGLPQVECEGVPGCGWGPDLGLCTTTCATADAEACAVLVACQWNARLGACT